MNPSHPHVLQCELPQGRVGTPRCTQFGVHIAEIHGCLLEQQEHEWVKVRVCDRHVVTAHKAWAGSSRSAGPGSPTPSVAVCSDCGKTLPRFRDVLRRVG